MHCFGCRPPHRAVGERLVAAARQHDERVPLAICRGEGIVYTDPVEIADVDPGLPGGIGLRRRTVPGWTAHRSVESLQGAQVPSQETRVADAVRAKPAAAPRIAQAVMNREMLRAQGEPQLLLDPHEFSVVHRAPPLQQAYAHLVPGCLNHEDGSYSRPQRLREVWPILFDLLHQDSQAVGYSALPCYRTPQADGATSLLELRRVVKQLI